MSETPVARLKAALIAHLTEAIEDGAVVVDAETGEPMRVTCPASLLAVAAKVVKDFHEEVGAQSVKDLEDVVARWKERKAEKQAASRH